MAKEVAVTTTQQSHNSTIERETSEDDTGSEKGGGSDGNECRSLFQGINGSSGGQEEYNFTCQEPTFSRQTRASSAFLRSEIGTGNQSVPPLFPSLIYMIYPPLLTLLSGSLFCTVRDNHGVGIYCELMLQVLLSVASTKLSTASSHRNHPSISKTYELFWLLYIYIHIYPSGFLFCCNVHKIKLLKSFLLALLGD